MDRRPHRRTRSVLLSNACGRLDPRHMNECGMPAARAVNDGTTSEHLVQLFLKNKNTSERKTSAWWPTSQVTVGVIMTQLRPPRAATPGTWLEANTCWPNTFAQNEKNAQRETSCLTAEPCGPTRQRMDHPHGRGRERERPTSKAGSSRIENASNHTGCTAVHVHCQPTVTPSESPVDKT